MRVAVVSTYPPRACGIGTFSQAVRTALLDADASTAADIVSIVREHRHADAAEVVATIRQDVRSDYSAVGRLLTSRGTDVVLVEHEYGIFGGVDGAFVLSLVAAIRQPIVVTLHTVLSGPSVSQAETLRALCHRATLVTVFTETARRMVIEAQLVPPERVRVIPHGAPTELLPVLGEAADTAAGHVVSGRATALQMAGLPRPALERLEGHTVLSTFGLISAGKGIETAIAALPAILERHPDVFYLIAGQTHPEVVKREGEQYRLGLERLVADLGITENVHFVDRFFTDDELAVLLQSTDLYITPYRSREQIVSGALTFAVVAGCPVVSTPYYYAEDLLSSGAGVLVPFDDPAALADGVLSLLDDPAALGTAAAEARRIGAELTWPAVGAQTLKVLSEAVSLGPVVVEDSGEEIVPAVSAPGIRPDHLLTLVDDVGIIQHADGVVPNRASGYCVDDVARLVIVALALDRSDSTYTRVLARGVSFLRHAWSSDAHAMHNFMSYDRQWLDDPDVGDHIGRAAWALGEVVAAQPPSLVGRPSLRLLKEMGPVLERSLSPHCVAYAVLGLSRIDPELMSAPLQALLGTLAVRLLDWYDGVARPEWMWLEDSLSYDNARLSQALVAAGHRLGNDAMLEAGLASLSWYAAQCGIDERVLRLVGNDGRRRGEWQEGHEGDEQPLDAAALVEAYVEAMIATGHTAYGRRALRAFEWFLGRNRLEIPVYDFATGGCHDGVGLETLNDNEGAESTLSFLQALLALDAAGLQASQPQP